LYWVAALSLVMGQLVLNAQNSSAKRSAPRNDRQKMAALKEAQRLSLKAETYEKQGKPAEAERTAERALALEEQARGAWHIDVAHRLDQVADLYTAHKKERAAESLYERARAIREQALSRHPDVYERDGGEIRARRNQPAEKALEPLPKTRQQ
jgi:tetratricopeptide (TPR) repeat protein